MLFQVSNVLNALGISALVYSFILAAPLWLPLVFLGFAIGRKRWTTRLLLMAITAEAIVIATAIGLLRVMSGSA